MVELIERRWMKARSVNSWCSLKKCCRKINRSMLIVTFFSMVINYEVLRIIFKDFIHTIIRCMQELPYKVSSNLEHVDNPLGICGDLHFCESGYNVQWFEMITQLRITPEGI